MSRSHPYSCLSCDCLLVLSHAHSKHTVMNAGLQKSEQKKRPEHVHLCDTLFIPAADDSDSRGPGSGRLLLEPVQLMFWRLQERPSERRRLPEATFTKTSVFTTCPNMQTKRRLTFAAFYSLNFEFLLKHVKSGLCSSENKKVNQTFKAAAVSCKLDYLKELRK